MSNSASGNIDIEAHTAYPPNPELDTGAEAHFCEHCKDFTLDFGLTDGELDEMLRDRVKDSLEAMGFTETFIEKLKEIRNRFGELAIFSDTRDQITQKANTGCKFYAFLSSATCQQNAGGNGILCAFSSKYSDLHIFGVGTLIEYKDSVSLCVPRDNPLAGEILNRPIISDPWSESTKAQVTQWMKDCSDTREMCPNEEGFFLPTYLIQLSPCLSKCPSKCPSDCCGFTLRLTKDIQGPVSYAALSYCWGGDQHFKTIKSNIHNLLHDIRYTDMPATLKDAAKVAFDLNFEFLWIDALCLIQDPGEYEIHTMIAEIPNIYRHATLTIAATTSKSVGEGFLNPRNIKNFAVLEQFNAFDGMYDFQIAIKNLFGKSGFAMIRTYHLSDRRSSPIIDTRGWTLQEQVLSTRYLAFSNTVTRWQFYGGSSDEGSFIDGGTITARINPLHSISSKWKIARFSKSPKTSQNQGLLWQKLIKQYMRRNLSILKDRPIAISALASDLGDASDYVAGVWLSHLCHGLSWVVGYPQTEAVVGYYAPSWSWWSARGHITWLVRQNTDMYQEPQFQLVEYYSELAHPAAPFGYLVQASLRVEARCGQVLVRDHQVGEYRATYGFEYGTSNYIHLSIDHHIKKEGMIWDRPDENAEGQVLRLLVLFVSKETERICGLILADVTNDGNEQDRKCCRVGAFDFWWQIKDDKRIFIKWLREQPVETLTLV